MHSDRYDVVVLGSGLAGSSLALLLGREAPRARILRVEATEHFGPKVGEATVEVSGRFLEKTLGLGDHLAREQLDKHGLRYWFTDRSDRQITEMSEVGPRSPPTVVSFQLDRAVLDEEVSRRADAAGAELARPAKVVDVELGWPESTVTISSGGKNRTVQTRWVVDATGRRAFIARRRRLLERLTECQTAAMWGRWSGVADPDDLVSADGGPALRPLGARRRLATNHFCGYGWWAWVIPLADGRSSIGLVWDRGLFKLPDGPSTRARYQAFVARQPGLRDLLGNAQLDERDFHHYGNLAYRSRQYAAPGWALVGDAAAFLDPYYSPGLDHLSISVCATASLLADDLVGHTDQAALDQAIARHNQRFERSFGRWYRALYEDKYEILGDAELTAASFLLETALYYLGVVTPVYRDPKSLEIPILGFEGRSASLAYWVLRRINRRMCKLARFRRHVGSYGRRNAGWRLYPPAFGLGNAVWRQFLTGLKIWGLAELQRMRHRVTVGSLDLSQPVGQERRSV